MPNSSTASILRRCFHVVAILSAIAFGVLAASYVRQYFATDVFYVFRWNPSTRAATDLELLLNDGGVCIRMESTTDQVPNNMSAIPVEAETSKVTFRHEVGTHSRLSGCPLILGGHYHFTPDAGDESSPSDCWTLEFRCDGAMVLFALTPMLWAAPRIRRAFHRRRSASRGFAVIQNT